MTGGDTIASDDITGVKHQRIKIEYGDDGSATDVSAANPLPVKTQKAATNVEISTTNLAASASWSTSWFDASIGGANFLILAKADKKLKITHDLSLDGSTVAHTHDHYTDANFSHYKLHSAYARYHRFTFTNVGASITTSIFLSAQQTIEYANESDSGVAEDLTITPLGISATYTSSTFTTRGRAWGVSVYAYADQAGTVYMDYSHDGATFINADSHGVTASTTFEELHLFNAPYGRVRFVNGGVAQGTFYMTCVQRSDPSGEVVKISADHNDVTAHGEKTHNSSTPGSDAVEALTAIANAVAPTYGEGKIVHPRVTLSGDTAITLDGETVALVSNQSMNVSQINGVVPLMGAGNTGTGSPRVTIASDQAVIPVKTVPATSGGQSGYTAISTAAVLSVAIKASAGQVYGYSFFNNTAGAIFVRLYNMATAPGTGDTPVRRIMIPANGGVEREIGNGMEFTTGIGIRATGLAPDNDATALTANTVLFNVDYE